MNCMEEEFQPDSEQVQELQRLEGEEAQNALNAKVCFRLVSGLFLAAFILVALLKLYGK